MEPQRFTLEALTPEARAALDGRDLVVVPSDCLPFRVGRECRLGAHAWQGTAHDRRQASRPNNDLYLHDPGSVKHVSREHFQIDRDAQGKFTVTDRGSACGVTVGSTSIGGNRRQESAPLHPDNVIIVGGRDSPYAFKFSLAYASDTRPTPETECSPSASWSPA